ncbi:MAG: hypothetical protein LBC19_13105 [Tannerella sp.]|jgi:hypothetical protein|nr:hypothetical protein [Tannerella sp.]
MDDFLDSLSPDDYLDDRVIISDYIKNMSSEERERLTAYFDKMSAKEANIEYRRLEREYNERKRKQEKIKSVTA